MKILALDIDGVLNTQRGTEYWDVVRRRDPEAYDRKYDFFGCNWCPTACANLSSLMDSEPDLRLVISSTWRLGCNLGRMRQYFLNRGLKWQHAHHIIGMTPDLSRPSEDVARGLEIQAWLDKNAKRKWVSGFAIVDDDSDMSHLKHKLVQTRMEEGLTMEHVERIREILKEPL